MYVFTFLMNAPHRNWKQESYNDASILCPCNNLRKYIPSFDRLILKNIVLSPWHFWKLLNTEYFISSCWICITQAQISEKVSTFILFGVLFEDQKKQQIYKIMWFKWIKWYEHNILSSSTNSSTIWRLYYSLN